MSEETIIMYGTDWCRDCICAKNFFRKHAVAFTWVNIDNDKEGESFVRNANGGMRIVPTILFDDGSMLVEPTNEELAQKLGISGT